MASAAVMSLAGTGLTVTGTGSFTGTTTIGSTSSNVYLSVENNTAATANVTLWNAAGSGDNVFAALYTEGGGTLRGSIDFNRGGTAVRYNTTSDMNLKTLIGDAPAKKSIEKIMGIRLREYFWNADETKKPQIGPFAQELYETFPGAVSRGGDDPTVEKYKPWGVDKTAPVFHLVAVAQTHESRLAALEQRIKQLEQ